MAPNLLATIWPNFPNNVLLSSLTDQRNRELPRYEVLPAILQESTGRDRFSRVAVKEVAKDE